MLIGNSLNFPTFITAKSPELLSAAMLKNNLAHRKEFKYYDIQFAKGKWYAWFEFDHSSTMKHAERQK